MRPPTDRLPGRQRSLQTDPSQVPRTNHLQFAAILGVLALLLLASGIVLLMLIGISSQDNLFAVPLLGTGLGAAALAVRHLLAAWRARRAKRT